jgi:hypothetical protein
MQVYPLVPPQLASREVTPLGVELGADEEDTRVEDPEEVLLALVEEAVDAFVEVINDELAGLLDDADVESTLDEELDDNPHLPKALWQPVPQWPSVLPQ